MLQGQNTGFSTVTDPFHHTEKHTTGKLQIQVKEFGIVKECKECAFERLACSLPAGVDAIILGPKRKEKNQHTTGSL